MLITAPEVPLPPRAAVERAKIELDRALGPSKVDARPETLESFARDESEAIGRAPDVVVHAVSVADVQAVLRVADETGVPVTPRAGGTGRTGGAVPVAGGIVLDTSTMNQILEIDRDELLCVVEPGIVTGDLHDLVENEGLFYPPDPNSLKSCMIGGNVAHNAGGPRAFKYGVTRDWVLGLEAATIGGSLLRTGKRTVKGVTGYDLTALLVGSEGTLAVTTKATLRLARKPEGVATLLGIFDDVAQAARSVTDLIRSGCVPRCIELMDEGTLAALRAQSVAIDPAAKALLLVEVDGPENLVEYDTERAGNAMAPFAKDVLAAQDAAQRGRLWEARRALSPATKKLAKYKLSEDVVVPRTRIVDLLEAVEAFTGPLGVRHLTYGHAGDGNLHVNFLWDEEEERPRVDRAIHELMVTTVRLGGTLSGEHGIGITKAQYLPLEQAPELVALQRDVKRVFDPRGLLNPGKIFTGAPHVAC